MRSKADVSTPRTIRRQQLREIVPLADSTIYEMEQRGEFPRRFALSPRCVGCGRVSATPERAHGSTQLLHTGRRISAVCRLGDHSYVVGSRSMPPVTALMRRVRADVAAVVSRTTAGKYRKARPSLMLER
jgi:predicted DNA-binding transcriptional regulator AlpA